MRVPFPVAWQRGRINAHSQSSQCLPTVQQWLSHSASFCSLGPFLGSSWGAAGRLLPRDSEPVAELSPGQVRRDRHLPAQRRVHIPDPLAQLASLPADSAERLTINRPRWPNSPRKPRCKHGARKSSHIPLSPCPTVSGLGRRRSGLVVGV